MRYKTVCVSLRLWRGRAPPLAGLRAFLAAGRRPPVPPFSPARPKNAMNLQIVRQHATKSDNKQQFQDGRRHKNNDTTIKKHRSGANDSKMSDQLPTGSAINGSSGVVLGSRDPLRGWGAARRAGETRPRAPPSVALSTLTKNNAICYITSNASRSLLTACRGAPPPDP